MDKITEILKDLPEHRKIALRINSGNDMPNILLYGHRSFPLQIILYYAFLHDFRRIPCVYGKDIHYHTSPYFIEIDFNNPMLPRDLHGIPAFIKSVIMQEPIVGQKHIIILRNIDSIEQKPFCNILEDFSSSVWFLCTTHRLNNVSDPIRSRMMHIRVPASPRHFPVKNAEIAEILKTPAKTTMEVRAKAYKLLQTAASFSEIAAEFVAQQKNPSIGFIRAVAELEHKYASTPGARIPIFLERLLFAVSPPSHEVKSNFASLN